MPQRCLPTARSKTTSSKEPGPVALAYAALERPPPSAIESVQEPNDGNLMSLDWEHHRFVELAAKGDRIAAQDALRRGVAIDQPDSVGGKLTALVAAADKGQPEIVRLLIEAGADVNAPSGYGDTALLRACRLGYSDVVEALLEAGAKPDLECGASKSTALLEALGFLGSARIVAALLRAGANPNGLPGSAQLPPLLRVCGESSLRDPAAIELLLQAGAAPAVRTQSGESALHVAAHWGEPPKIAALLRAGLDPRDKAPNGCDALHLAASAPRNADAILMLLQAGARKETLDSQQRTAFERALENIYFPAEKLAPLLPERDLTEEDLLIVLRGYFDELQGKKAIWMLSRISAPIGAEARARANKWDYEPLSEALAERP